MRLLQGVRLACTIHPPSQESSDSEASRPLGLFTPRPGTHSVWTGDARQKLKRSLEDLALALAHLMLSVLEAGVCVRVFFR